jgi:hypothetical protein
MSTTEPNNRINECLSHFAGMFTKKNLKKYYNEAIMIVDQDFEVLKNSKCLFEIINLVIGFLKHGMIKTEYKILNCFNICFHGLEKIYSDDGIRNTSFNEISNAKTLQKFMEIL